MQTLFAKYRLSSSLPAIECVLLTSLYLFLYLAILSCLCFLHQFARITAGLRHCGLSSHKTHSFYAQHVPWKSTRKRDPLVSVPPPYSMLPLM